MAISSAYPNVKAIYKDKNSVDPDILFDVVIWQDNEGTEIGRIVVEGSTKLIHPAHAPVPANYVFKGYGYCA